PLVSRKASSHWAMMSTMALPMQSTSKSGINVSASEPAGFLPRPGGSTASPRKMATDFHPLPAQAGARAWDEAPSQFDRGRSI
ncbi:hypothetical protein, partial [Mesorhizobium sp. LNJC384A00]|uniref:hypothetical protein n=1 Tax=Mesorhizobium sp. LNJC384A00 TaxID=1287268 RepID=UPI001AEC5523